MGMQYDRTKALAEPLIALSEETFKRCKAEIMRAYKKEMAHCSDLARCYWEEAYDLLQICQSSEDVKVSKVAWYVRKAEAMQ